MAATVAQQIAKPNILNNSFLFTFKLVYFFVFTKRCVDAAVCAYLALADFCANSLFQPTGLNALPPPL